MSRDETIDRFVGAARYLHPPLCDKRSQQFIEQLHQGGIARQLVRTVTLDGLDAIFLNVTRHDAREYAAQVCCQLMRRLCPVELERAHRLMSDLKGLLEFRTYRQQPV